MTSLTLSEASHLARRAGFAAQDHIIEILQAADDKSEAIQTLVSLPPSLIDLPDWHDAEPFGRAQDDAQREENMRLRRSWGRELKYWWFQQMQANTSPLAEKMTLFWANHFTSSLQKVKWPPAMLAQNQLLRTHSMGSFRDMLKGILRDPAMLVYLDNANSQKDAPNENLARELLELFTLGEGEYSEQDIKELARTLTGATVNRRTGAYQFRRRMHDTGSKTIFGQTGTFAPDDVADLILAQPQVAPFITDKLWRFFVNDTPDQNDIEQIATEFAASDFQISTLLEQLFASEAFWLSQGSQIKSPMELMVGSSQLFALPQINQRQFLRVSRALTQDLFDPPHVKGWAEGKAWYNTSTVAVREQVTKLVASRAQVQPPLEQMLALSSVANLPESADPSFVALVVNDPAYQVV